MPPEAREAGSVSPPAADDRGMAPSGNAPVPAAAFPASGPFTRRFEFVGGGSNKFWEISLEGDAVTVRFGRIGSAGQSQKKVFADDAKAAAAARSLIREKTGKGYQERAL